MRASFSPQMHTNEQKCGRARGIRGNVRPPGVLSRFAACVFALTLRVALPGQVAPTVPLPNIAGQIDRPLRYRPDGPDFVIENGTEFFNRPLYGGNTGFRVDAGDRPEFSLYLPGRGGNLRLGFRTPAGTRWLFDAATVTARYRPGMMSYEIRDPALGPGGIIQLDAIAFAAMEGLGIRVEARGIPGPVEIVWAFGGANGQRGVRDGDIGTEAVPIGEYFQLKPEFCRGNTFDLGPRQFTLRSGQIRVVGLLPVGTAPHLADASDWATWEGLAASAAPALPVVVGSSGPLGRAAIYFGLVRPEATAAAPQPDEVPALFAAASAHFDQLRERVHVSTPDPYLDAAVGALNVAVDAVWDEPQGSVMHGAVAWRQRLLGWRGPYAQDALGWHDRARRNFTYWAGRQNTNPVPAALPPPDEGSNLARSEAALHSNGDMSNSHYDMNAVFIDALFRHLEWTGDLSFARQMWPVIERHLAWERRLFRRPFGPDGLPLYEAYAMIWASDDLGYSGGGVAHASAYNYAHNRQAARLARLLGHDPAPYEREADAIAKAMRQYLWLPDGGFAEAKDLLGEQMVHPAAGLWTFYITIDSGMPTAEEAWQMARKVDSQTPHLPVRGPGVPADADYHVLSTTNWMPYSWSINNVVMGEVMHAALGYWQAGRPGEANVLLKSALLASMYMGICPGNVGSMDYLDVYRRESQRDFADGGGVMSRALIEGLFGIRPDLLADSIRIAPGFPSAWSHASIHHPEFDFAFRRDGTSDLYSFVSRFPRPAAVDLVIPGRGGDVSRITVDGRAAEWRPLEDSATFPRIAIRAPAAADHEIVVTWRAAEIPSIPSPAAAAPPSAAEPPGTDWSRPLPEATGFETVDLGALFNDSVTQIFRHEYRTPRSPFASLGLPKQGIGAWAGHVNATAEIDDGGIRAAARAGGGRITLPNGVPFATPSEAGARNIAFTSHWDNFPRAAAVPLSGRASRAYLLMAGSTDWMHSRMTNGEVVFAYTDGSTTRLALDNPTNWWPIDQDYFIDDYQFRRPGPIPPRLDLKSGRFRLPDTDAFKGHGTVVPGGAATVIEMPLDPAKTLQSATVRARANEVVIGLMALTLAR